MSNRPSRQARILAGVAFLAGEFFLFASFCVLGTSQEWSDFTRFLFASAASLAAIEARQTAGILIGFILDAEK